MLTNEEFVMQANPIYMELDQLVARIPNGANLAVPKEESGVAIETTHALIRRDIVRSRVARKIAETYPDFTATKLGYN